MVVECYEDDEPGVGGDPHPAQPGQQGRLRRALLHTSQGQTRLLVCLGLHTAAQC